MTRAPVYHQGGFWLRMGLLLAAALWALVNLAVQHDDDAVGWGLVLLACGHVGTLGWVTAYIGWRRVQVDP